MSKLFYDHLIVLEEIETVLNRQQFDSKDKEVVGQVIEETVHYRVMTRILDHLPREHHQEFLERFHQAPYDASLLAFLKEKVDKIEDFIREEIDTLKKELLKELGVPPKSPKKP